MYTCMYVCSSVNVLCVWICVSMYCMCTCIYNAYDCKKPLQFVIAVTLHKCYHVEYQEHLQLGKTSGWFTYFQNRYLFPIAIRYWHPINRNMKKPVSICPRRSWWSSAAHMSVHFSWGKTQRRNLLWGPGSLLCEPLSRLCCHPGHVHLQWDHPVTSSCGGGKAPGSGKGVNLYRFWIYIYI